MTNFDFVEMLPTSENFVFHVASRARGKTGIESWPALVPTDKPAIRYRLVTSNEEKIGPHAGKWVRVAPQRQFTKGGAVKWIEIEDACSDNIMLASPSDILKKWALMTSDDDKVMNILSKYYYVVNRSDKEISLKPNKPVSTLRLLQPGKFLKQLDAKNLMKYEEDGIDDIIAQKASGGLQIGKPGNIAEIESGYEKTLARQHGFHVPEEAFDEASNDNLEKMKIVHSDSCGGAHNMELPIGNMPSVLKRRFKRFMQQHSEVFFDDPEGFPYLTTPEGKPIYHSLALRDSAILKNVKAHISLPPSHQSALKALVKKKLMNQTFVRVKSDDSYYCSPVSIVPKSSVDEHGNKKYRLVQNLISLSEQSLHLSFKLKSPREILEGLPPGSKKYCIFDSTASFDSLLLEPSEQKFTAFMAVCPETQAYKPFASSRFPQGHLNGTAHLTQTYAKIFGDEIARYGLGIYCDDFILGAKDDESLMEALEAVIKKALRCGVRFGASKSSFVVEKGVFCGLMVKNGSTTITLKYAKKVTDTPKPKNEKELSRFLGLLCYVRNYIPHYSRYGRFSERISASQA